MLQVASGFRAGCLFLACMMTAVATVASAQDSDIKGDCSDFSFFETFGETGLVSRDGKSVYAFRDGAPMYDAATGGSVVREAKFSDPLKVVEVMTRSEMASERVRVEIPSLSRKDQGVFWMTRQDLLCRTSPLRDQTTNLERKALIRTQTKERQDGVIQAITAYRTPDVSDEQSDDSRRLSRFQTYMIYAESDKAFLLAELFTLTTVNDKLVGWVKKEDVLQWNWAIGLRPPLNFYEADGKTPKTICGYESPTDRSVCIPILGGNSWFKGDKRLPVIDVGEDYYHVVGAASGLGSGEIRDGKMILTKEMAEKLKISPDDLAAGVNTEKINAFNKIDVFFLIDGTKSMTPYIDAIKGGQRPGVVENIVNAIRDKNGDGVTVRAGFQVFRDSVSKDSADSGRNDGIGESLDFTDNNCNDEDQQALEDAKVEFKDRLQSIVTTTNDNDDYDENLYGGLRTAALNMQACPERQKMLFVISDAGYDAEMQRSRGHNPVSQSEVEELLRENKKLSIFFIRPPMQDRSNFSSDKSYDLYEESWNEFEQLGHDIAGNVMSRDIDTDRLGNYVFTLSAGSNAPQELYEKISADVGSMSQPQILNEILVDLRGGAALAHVIQRLQRENEDVPILYFNMIKRTVCEEDQSVCNQRIYDGVVDLYIPKSEPHELDAWLKSEQLTEWTRLIRPIVQAELNNAAERKALKSIVINALQGVLNIPPPEKIDEDIGSFLSRSGRLPGPIKTPFLRYSFRDLSDPDKISSCELDRLKVWLRASKAMLDNATNNLLSDPKVEIPEVDCPDLSPQGADLKYIPQEPQGIPAGPDINTYKLSTPYLGAVLFWVPLEYLP
jgi:hypothetical protein